MYTRGHSWQILETSRGCFFSDEFQCQISISTFMSWLESLSHGTKLLGYWQEDDAWYPCHLLKFHPKTQQLKVQWEDFSTSKLSQDEVRAPKRKAEAEPNEARAKRTKQEVGGTEVPQVPRSLTLKRHQLPPHRYVLAPMVGGSELPFRMMTRQYGTQLCYTPMIYSGPFSRDQAYREAAENGFQTCPEDRPLVVHFCGNDPEVLLQAAKHVEHLVDAIDLNLGCPQRVAHAEHFGSLALLMT